MLASLLAVFCSVLFALPVGALAIEEVPNPRLESGSWISDMVGLLKPEQQQSLDREIDRSERDVGVELAIAIVPETQPAPSAKYFALRLFNYWGVGKRGQNNGVLILVSMADRRVEIRTGKGIRPVLTDEIVQTIIDRNMLPEFRQENFAHGIVLGTEGIINAIHEYDTSIAEIATHRAITYPKETVLRDYLLTLLTFGVSGGLMLAWAIRPQTIQVNRGERSSSRASLRNLKLVCQTCELPMVEVDSKLAARNLTREQKIAANLGSVRFSAWQCPENCQRPYPNQDLHWHECILSDEFRVCETCKERTIKHSVVQVTKRATVTELGDSIVNQSCISCGFDETWEAKIPRIIPDTAS